ncbi:hypothetical protein [Cupriavidus pauculus]|uniref:Lactate dehydrogenase n=1 Tax=Cupriavidus pauculus TaxID=82633 RepID=A0A2N5C439_9BURK|nr:hypothetical protein [Cupriavidus pauculus]PLP96993.1 hypothetical protein CYJ10_29565 [Cupriavidus pauculus]
MVAISSVGSQGLVGTAGANSAPAATAAPSQAQATSATTVTLGRAAPAPANWPTYSAKSMGPTPVWEHAIGDPISMRMAGNVSASKLSARFSGLGEALMNQVAGGGASFSQSVIQLSADEPIDAVSSSSFQAHSSNEIQLTITTRGGATVGFTLGSDGDRLRVQASVTDGQLSDSEREALGKLSASFQKSIDALNEVPPRLDLAGLMQYDATQLASVHLQANLALGNNETQTLDFQADDKVRSVTSTGPTGTVKLSVDTTGPTIFGTPAQQAKAVGQYLKQFDDAKVRGQGDTALIAMFKDAFSALHSHYNTASTQQSRFTFSAGDHGMLTGLADFSASISQAPVSINPLRSNETDTFDYQVSQTTQLLGRGQADRGARQQQQSSLDASYHSALSADTPLSLNESPYSQNYYYEQIHDKASSESEFAYRKGDLMKATITQSVDQSRHTQKYVMGHLEEDSTTPTSKSRTIDVLALVKAAQNQSGTGLRRNDEARERVLSSMHDKVLLVGNAAGLAG